MFRVPMVRHYDSYPLPVAYLKNVRKKDFFLFEVLNLLFKYKFHFFMNNDESSGAMPIATSYSGYNSSQRLLSILCYLRPRLKYCVI